MDEAARKYNRRCYLAERDRFLNDGGGCGMQELGELLREKSTSQMALNSDRFSVSSRQFLDFSIPVAGLSSLPDYFFREVGRNGGP
jgi:hypothetical protein